MKRLTAWHHAFWGKLGLALIAATCLSAVPILAQPAAPKTCRPGGAGVVPRSPGAGSGQRTGGLCYWG